MKKSKSERLKAAGWKLGDAQEFLGLTHEEAALINLKLACADILREQRRKMSLTQTSLAKRIRSSQSRVAKMEAGDVSVSLDLMFRSAFSLGVSYQELGRAITRIKKTKFRSRKGG